MSEPNPVRVAAGRKSKRKGNNAERAVAKAFQEWWGWGLWARTPASGGWATAAHRQDFNTCGDVTTTATDFSKNYVIENKKCEGWTLDQLIHNEACVVLTWWKQAFDETPKGMIPLLVIARNHIPQAIIFDGEELSAHLKQLHNDVLGTAELQPWRFLPHFIYTGADRRKLVITSLKSFFRIDPALLGRKIPDGKQA
jgi:hypothetical protein